MTFKDFKSRLQEARTEETVKAVYARYFGIPYDTADQHDLYTPQVFFEFKHDRPLTNLKSAAMTLAQALYYIRRLKYEDTQKIISPYLCLADKTTALLTETKDWFNYYTSDAYDWELPPSRPDEKLVDHLVKEPKTQQLHIYQVQKRSEHTAFEKRLRQYLTAQPSLDFIDKKDINEENFEAVFEHWRDIIGRYITNGYKDSFYFLSNIQRDKVLVDRENNQVVFTFEDKNSKVQRIVMKDYEYFWSIYDHVSDTATISGIHAKLDRLTDESQRRFEGEFYTPIRFAKKALHYWEQVLGKGWYKSGKYRLWDMAAGTGNLEYHLPAEAYPYTYLSTLHRGEAEHLKRVFPGATCFQYDYLNDDVEYLFNHRELPFEPNWKLPKKLREELQNPELTWIVHINPPFATSQDARGGGRSKKGVSQTRIERWMNQEKLGHVKRELFAQFMYRIVHEMPEKTYLGMFSTLKYLNAPDSVRFRDTYFRFRFKKGFVFHSKNFHGVTGDFPIGFLTWDLSDVPKRKRRKIKLEISDDDTQSIGIKHLRLIDRQDVLNRWFSRPQNSKDYILPPLSNGLTIKEGNIDVRHRARPDFLASICSNGNDFQHSRYVVILSSPNASAGAFTVNPAIFEPALTLHAVRKIPRPTWLNDRNQFLSPHTPPSQEFTNDCVVWSLFANSNETTALKDVTYRGGTYQIKNHFFPFLTHELESWEVREPDFQLQLSRDTDRFVAGWLAEREGKLSAEAQAVLEAGRQVYRVYFANLHRMVRKDLKIETWDAGWYQIRRCLVSNHLAFEELEHLQNIHQQLGDKILPYIEHYGFMDKDELFETR